jgi:hypothetical protein
MMLELSPEAWEFGIFQGEHGFVFDERLTIVEVAGADERKDPFDSLGRHVPLAENRISTAIGSSPSHPSACVLEYILQIGLLHQHCEAE